MPPRSSNKDALIPLLNELYQRIYDAEAAIGLFVGSNDHRPRIERFHDAIRAYTSGVSPYTAHSRLALEQLAWDISMLRTIQANPLQPMPNSHKQSAGTQVAVRTPNAVGDVGNPHAHARELKSQLAQDYKNYAVMFTAILAETADMNHASRMDEKDAIVEQMATMRGKLSGKLTDLQKLAGSTIYDPEILANVQSLLPKEILTTDKATAALNQAMHRIDGQQKNLDATHVTWLSGQLAMYEQGKEVVQQLMQKGMNIAGKFLEEAMGRGGQGQGRGY